MAASTNDQLEKRIRDLETTRTIVIAVAVIFGVSGGWGAYRLNQINTALDKAEARVKGLETDAGAATATLAARAQSNQVQKPQPETTGVEGPTNAPSRPRQQVRDANNPAVKTSIPDEKPFQAAVGRFRRSAPPEPYAIEGYKSDLKGLSELLLGYLGYLQSGNHIDKSTSDAFFGQVLLASTDVKSRSSAKLPQSDPYFEWHTKTSLDNFVSIVGRMKNDQESTPDNTIPASRITFYEIDIPHWRDGVLGIPLG